VACSLGGKSSRRLDRLLKLRFAEESIGAKQNAFNFILSEKQQHFPAKPEDPAA